MVQFSCHSLSVFLYRQDVNAVFVAAGVYLESFAVRRVSGRRRVRVVERADIIRPNRELATAIWRPWHRVGSAWWVGVPFRIESSTDLVLCPVVGG